MTVVFRRKKGMVINVNKIPIYSLIMAAVTYVIRVLPLVLIRGEIKNRTVRSFLYYVPYVTLSVMTVPAIFEATRTPIAGAAALAAGIILALRGRSMFTVAVVCPLVVVAVEFVIFNLL